MWKAPPREAEASEEAVRNCFYIFLKFYLLNSQEYITFCVIFLTYTIYNKRENQDQAKQRAKEAIQDIGSLTMC